MTLIDLGFRRAAIVAGFAGDPEVETLLREIGFAEHDEVEILGAGPLGGSPLSVRLNRTIVALRRAEAAAIQVSVAS